MIRRLLAATRYIVLLPILGTFMAAVGLMLFETDDPHQRDDGADEARKRRRRD